MKDNMKVIFTLQCEIVKRLKCTFLKSLTNTVLKSESGDLFENIEQLVFYR